MSVDFTYNWDAMTGAEKTAWLSQHVLKNEQLFEFGENKDSYWLIHQCESIIKESRQRQLWIENVTSEVSAHVYNGMSDREIQSQDTLWLYYEHFHTAPVTLRGRAIYFAQRGLKV